MDGASGFGETMKLFLRETFFFDTAKEALDDAILLGGVRRQEFLVQPQDLTFGACHPQSKFLLFVVLCHMRCIRLEGSPHPIAVMPP